MKLGDIKIIDRISAVEAIKQLNEEDLLLVQTHFPGTVLHLNKKNVSVAIDDDH